MTKIFLIAGEESGDLLGASLMQDIKSLDSSVTFLGVGGSRMQSAGLASLFPMQELSVMGLFEVLRHLPRILKRMRQTIDAILVAQPDILVTIDSPDFCLRVAKTIKRRAPQIKIVHYVAPTVWAWRPGRARKIARFLDGLMCLFPFEPPFFTRHGLRAQFVGHPLVKTIKMATPEQREAFCRKYGLDSQKPILCLLPGSRRREIASLWPLFITAAKTLHHEMPNLQIIVPTLPHLKPRLQGTPFTIIDDVADKYTAFQCSAAALHASGTVALELALCGTPMVTAYKVNPVTAWLASRLLKTQFVNLVNILAAKPIIPELLQEQATPENFATALKAILSNPVAQVEFLKTVASTLKENSPQAAAVFVKNILLNYQNKSDSRK